MVKQFSKVDIHNYTPPNNELGFQLLHILVRIWYCQSFQF